MHELLTQLRYNDVFVLSYLLHILLEAQEPKIQLITVLHGSQRDTGTARAVAKLLELSTFHGPSISSIQRVGTTPHLALIIACSYVTSHSFASSAAFTTHDTHI